MNVAAPFRANELTYVDWTIGPQEFECEIRVDMVLPFEFDEWNTVDLVFSLSPSRAPEAPDPNELLDFKLDIAALQYS